MNLPSIHNKSKDNALVLTEQKKLELVQNLAYGNRVSDTATQQLVNFLSAQITKAYQLSGLKKLNEDDLSFAINFLYQEIRKNFSSLTSKEIEHAFECGICGEYGDFNRGLGATTFVQFLRAYKRNKESIQNSVTGRIEAQKEKEDQQEKAEQAKTLNIEFLENKYSEFCDIIKEAENMVNQSKRFSLYLDSVEIASYTSAVEQEEGELMISTKQMNWIDNTVNSLQFDFDRNKFGTGLEAKRKFDKYKEQERMRVFKSLCLQLHFGNKVAHGTGVVIGGFLNLNY